MLSVINNSLIFVSILCLFLSCGSIDRDRADEVAFKTIKYEDRTGDCDSAYSENCAQIKIEFPEIEFNANKQVEAAINSKIRHYLLQAVSGDVNFNSFEEMVEKFLGEYESFKKDFPEAFQQWNLERVAKVRFNRENIFSVGFSEYSYLGGAHPNTYISYVNFDLTSGEEIKLENLFNNNFKDELNKIAEPEFRILKELGKDEDLGKAGFWFEDNKFKLNDNFLITDSSLIFYYNNYEITAYAYGPTELEIPYIKIKHLFSEDSLLPDLIKKF